MTDMQKAVYEREHERFCVSTGDVAIDFNQVFGNGKPLVLEIGFGMGMATAEIAQKLPDINFIGIEVHRPGVGKLMSEIMNRGLSNLRIVERDAIEVLERCLPNECLSGVHLFFPDPWPKKKHHKRRIVNERFLSLISAKLKSGGYFYMTTDWEEYAHEALSRLEAFPGLKNSAAGFSERQAFRPVTKFEQRAIRAGRPTFELYFLKP
jgi:tRNA (guanine-N7-)-methyltransferase